MIRATHLLGLVAFGAIISLTSGRNYKMVCYYSSWATYRNGNGRFTSDDIDPNVCTHIVYAFAGLDFDYRIKILDPWLSLEDGGGKGDFRKLLDLKRRNPALKLLIGVGGWNEGSQRYSQMASVARNRRTFIDSAVEFIRRYEFDGLNLDWQYPANRGGLSSDKTYFPVLLKEIRQAFDNEGRTRWELGISAAANIDIINAGYDVPEVTKAVDFVSLLTYDYHGAWETRTGANSPLYPRKGDSSLDRTLNQDASVQKWIQKGADKSKLLLGLVTYGRTFMLREPSRNRVGDSATRPGNPGRFTQQDGFLGYNEIIEMYQESDNWRVEFDDESKVPYAYNDFLWISYDNERSFGLKAEYIKKQQLGGAMIWSLDTDDFQGASGRVNPLLKTVQEVLEDGKVVPTSDPVTGRPPTGSPVTNKPGKLECKTTGSFRHPLDCTKYYTCVTSGMGLIAHVNQCPAGLVFDERAKACNWADAVPECST